MKHETKCEPCTFRELKLRHIVNHVVAHFWCNRVFHDKITFTL